ncbi:hypothetical protein FFA01_14690 [Frigoribacterium faeni]|uniref:Acyl-CoA carboxylase subunit epsilon n=2 Tax=Frigoribacterium faeni TaxID=145483 RepID=A0ABQ0UNU6_9MICO|nr:hypothetical protein GCM10025699_46140 [Microbacterium flavescens]GEK83160.1 hypothetical protein FFA01_14690 [Frigoribacterium faeni]
MSGRHAAETPVDPEEARPMDDVVLRVVAGRPTDDELAAVTAVLAALEAEAAATAEVAHAPAAVSAWYRSSRRLRGPVVPGPGHWRGFSG